MPLETAVRLQYQLQAALGDSEQRGIIGMDGDDLGDALRAEVADLCEEFYGYSLCIALLADHYRFS